MAGGRDTVIELVNMIGSAFYGPIAALFIIGMILRFPGQWEAVAAMIGGVSVNVYLWLMQPGVSWMWWNLSGFVIAALVLIMGGTLRWCITGQARYTGYVSVRAGAPVSYMGMLLVWFFIMVIVCMVIEWGLTG